MAGYSFREVFEVYLVGAVILFTLSVGGTFFISFFKESVDLLVPLKTLTIYGILSFLLLDYLLYRYLDGLKKVVTLSSALASQVLVVSLFVPHLSSFFSESVYYTLGQYPFMFKVFPALSLLFAIAGVFVVVYYSVDIDPGSKR